MRRIYVKNIPLHYSDTLLNKIFSRYGRVTKAYIIRDRFTKSRGFGFVSFHDTFVAQNLVRMGFVMTPDTTRIFCEPYEKNSRERPKLIKPISHQKNSQQFLKKQQPTNLNNSHGFKCILSGHKPKSKINDTNSSYNNLLDAVDFTKEIIKKDANVSPPQWYSSPSNYEEQIKYANVQPTHQKQCDTPQIDYNFSQNQLAEQKIGTDFLKQAQFDYKSNMPPTINDNSEGTNQVKRLAMMTCDKTTILEEKLLFKINQNHYQENISLS